MTRRRIRHRRSYRPQWLITDRGYDSNQVRALLVRCEIELIIPRRRHDTVATHQDRLKLRRCRRRWSMERVNSWLQNFRRLVACYEHLVKNFKPLIHMACLLITVKKVLG